MEQASSAELKIIVSPILFNNHNNHILIKKLMKFPQS